MSKKLAGVRPTEMMLVWPMPSRVTVPGLYARTLTWNVQAGRMVSYTSYNPGSRQMVMSACRGKGVQRVRGVDVARGNESCGPLPMHRAGTKPTTMARTPGPCARKACMHGCAHAGSTAVDVLVQTQRRRHHPTLLGMAHGSCGAGLAAVC